MHSSDNTLVRRSRASRTLHQFWTILSLCVLLTWLIAGVISCGAVKTEIIYASSTKAVEETHGHMRLAQSEARVNVDGTDKVGIIAPCGAYYLVHKQDLIAFVRAAKRLAQSDAAGRLLKEDEVK